jgi:hypothetical protein
MSDIYTGFQFDKLADILLVKTRMDFLLLTMAPDKVRDQIVREFGNSRDMLGKPSNAARVVEQPR